MGNPETRGESDPEAIRLCEQQAGCCHGSNGEKSPFEDLRQK